MSTKNRWTLVKFFNKESLDTLSENEKILWNFYTEFKHMPKTFYNNNGKLVCR